MGAIVMSQDMLWEPLLWEPLHGSPWLFILGGVLAGAWRRTAPRYPSGRETLTVAA